MKNLTCPKSKGTHGRSTAQTSRRWAFLLSALCCLLQARVASAQAWNSTGPEGGPMQALAIDPTTPTRVYAGFGGGGVFGSADGGASWRPLNAGLTNTAVFSLTIDPANPTTLYAGTMRGPAAEACSKAPTEESRGIPLA